MRGWLVGVVLLPLVMWIIIANYGIVPPPFIEGIIGLLFLLFVVDEYRIRRLEERLKIHEKASTQEKVP